MPRRRIRSRGRDQVGELPGPAVDISDRVFSVSGSSCPVRWARKAVNSASSRPLSIAVSRLVGRNRPDAVGGLLRVGRQDEPVCGGTFPVATMSRLDSTFSGAASVALGSGRLVGVGQAEA